MTTTDITLNGVALSTAVPEAAVLKVSRPLVGTPRHVPVAVPGRSGSWRFDEEPGDGIIEIDVDLQADTFAERRSAVRALAGWSAPGTTANLIVDDEPDRYYEALLDRDPPVDEWLRDGAATLRFLVGAHAFATAQSSEAVAVSGAGSDSGTFSIDDDYSVEPVIEITPTDGTITSFTLTVNGASIAWQDGSPADPATILQDETITISTLSQTVTLAANVDVNLTGAFDPDDVDMAAVAISGFPDLVPGVAANSWSIAWTGTATTIDLDFTWRERFT